jgi:hypothetical protein
MPRKEKGSKQNGKNPEPGDQFTLLGISKVKNLFIKLGLAVRLRLGKVQIKCYPASPVDFQILCSIFSNHFFSFLSFLDRVLLYSTSWLQTHDLPASVF